MKELLLIAHGSRRESSNHEVRTLVERLSGMAMTGYQHTSCAFLELAEPSIPDGLEQCIARGATHIIVLPYFLAAGRHVLHDIPAEIEPVRARHPGIRIEIRPHIGVATGIPACILEHIT